MNATLAAAVALAHGVPFDDVAAGLATRAARAVAHGGGAHRRRRASCSTTPTTPTRRRWPPRSRRSPASRCPDAGSRSSARCASSASSATPEHAALGDLVGAHRGRRARRGRARRRHRSPTHARAAGVAVTEVPDAATALDAVAGFVARRRRGAGEGQPRGRPRAGRHRAAGRPDRRRTTPVIALLVGTGAAFMLCILTTPALIRVLKAKGIGQQIRDDGPFAHPHEKKAGTPTMGGIAIVVERARRLPRRARQHRADQVRAHRHHAHGARSSAWPSSASSTTTWACGAAATWVCASGARPAASSSSRSASRCSRCSTSTCRRTCRSPACSTSTSAPGLWFVVAVLLVYGFSNAVNLTDGIDGLAAGSAAMVFAAFVIIAFWQFRHPGVYHVLPAGVARPRHRGGGDDGRLPRASCGGTRRPRRCSWATSARSRSARRWPACRCSPTPSCCCRSSAASTCSRRCRVIAQVISFRCFHRRVLRMAPDPPPLRGGRLARVHGDRALLAARRPARRARARLLLRRLHPHPRGARLMRVLVVGLGDDGRVGGVVHARGRPRRHRARGPAARRRGDALPRPRRAAPSPTARACSRRPTPPTAARAGPRRRPRRPEPGRAPRPPRARRRATTPACRCARRSTSPPRACAPGPTRPRLVAVTGTNGKTTVTTLIDAMLRAAGHRAASPPATSGARCSTPPATTSTWSSPRCRRSSSRSPPTRSRPTSRCCSTWPRTTSTGTARPTPTRRPRRACSRTRAPTALLVVNGDDPVAARPRGRRTGRVVRFVTGAPAAGGYGVRRRTTLVGPAGAVLAPVPASGPPHDVANALAAAAAALEVGADVDAVAAHARRLRRPRPPGAAGGRARRRALLRRLEGHQPARHRRRARRASSTSC